jgi:transposase
MLGIEMYYTVKSLLSRGKNISEISRELGIDRKTVRKIREKVKGGEVETPKFSRVSILESYKQEIIEYLSEGLTAVLIHQKLTNEYNLSVSYSCVKKYVRKLKGPDGVYVPLISPPGEEAQVDFGYVGYFYDSRINKKVKCWIFCMVLSHSRYKYYEIVTSQDVESFLRCHINAFEYFAGAPKLIKIDNLKSGVLESNFYEPVIQREYASMLEYYGSSPFACKVKYPQEKGKVESGVKYAKNNFFKSTKEKDLCKIKNLLRNWQENICNKKIHGTTRKIPHEQFIEKEKPLLLTLPAKRYELYEVSQRVVNRYSHITYKYNYYSVPCKYVGSKVSIRSNNSVLKIYNDKYEEIAVHAVSKLTGEFITNEAHNPRLTQSDYHNKSLEIGSNVLEFYKRLKLEKPYHYHRMIRGIFSLLKIYDKEIIDLACKRAVNHNSISYLSVKKICESGIYSTFKPDETAKCSGYAHDLKIYDEISNRRMN